MQHVKWRKKKENFLKIEGAEAMKGVILKTDDGIKLFGCLQCSNGSWYTAEGCFKYCNNNKSEKRNMLQALNCPLVLRI